MKALNGPRVRWAMVAAWAGAIFILSAQSNLPAPPAPGIDKWEHAVAYALLAFLLARAWLPHLRRFRPSVRWALVVEAVFAYGIVDEIHQAFVPNRSCDPLDAAADLAGALVCAMVCVGLLRGTRWPGRLGLE